MTHSYRTPTSEIHHSTTFPSLLPHSQHHPTMSSSDQTVNLPQLIIVLVLGGLAIRYFFFSNSSPSTANRGASSVNNVRAREADVERIQQMFPQVSRRSIMWDLQRNGGNVVATTERILSGRGLEVVSLPVFTSPVLEEKPICFRTLSHLFKDYAGILHI